MQGTNAAGQGGQRALSPKPEKVHVTKEPGQQKNQKVMMNLLTTKTQSEKDYKSGLTSKAEKLSDELETSS